MFLSNQRLRQNEARLKQEEARFDHFMNYWYPILDQYCYDIELYTRMKKGTILDYIKTHNGYYIYENVPLFGGGYFPMRKEVDIEREIRTVNVHMAANPILNGPESRLEVRNAFSSLLFAGRELLDISEFDEELESDIDFLRATFEKIDSLNYEIHRNFIKLDEYRTTQYKFSNLNNLSSIPHSEYDIKNY